MKYWNENRKQYYTHVEPRADWREPVEKWVDWMDVVGRTKQTLRTRYYQLSRFSRVVNKKINDVNEDDIILVLAPLGEEAKRGMRAAIRMFYSWAIERKLATVDPTAGIPPIAIRRAHGKVCPKEAIEKGLGSTNNDARIAVMLGAFCGLRRIEIARINLAKDITDDENGMMLRIHGKGNKERELPVPAKLAEILRKRPKGWLFPGRLSGHCSVDYIAKLIKTATGYPSHSLRRRFATVAYYRTGCNVVLVSRMLGHANAATTMRYIGIVSDEMRNAVESATQTGMGITMKGNPVVGTPDVNYTLKHVVIG